MKFKSLSKWLLLATFAVTLPSCAFVDWLVYKQDLPQGNFIETKDVSKLRVEMTKEQVTFIIGRPVIEDTFGGDTWHYVSHFKSGQNAKVTHKEFILKFSDNKLVSATGDYELSEDFNTPISQ
ncbi:MAG: outer membrane protein assembly factor BamE [Gammaproteobacteria bacterium]|nr:outer membrane protein assembly factor BamE [Gammaproteobacteria bacterium]